MSILTLFTLHVTNYKVLLLLTRVQVTLNPIDQVTNQPISPEGRKIALVSPRGRIITFTVSVMAASPKSVCADTELRYAL